MALRRRAALAANVLLLAFAAATSAATVADVPAINAMCPVLSDEPADSAITVELDPRLRQLVTRMEPTR